MAKTAAEELAELWGSDSDNSSAGGGGAAGGKGDDVWGSDGEDEAPRDVAKRDEEAMRKKHFNEGYKDSVAYAREAALQQGFGEGFRRGFSLGAAQGKILGVCSTAAGEGAADALGGLVQSAKKVCEEHGGGEAAQAASLKDIAGRASEVLGASDETRWAAELLPAEES